MCITCHTYDSASEFPAVCYGEISFISLLLFVYDYIYHMY